MEEYEVWLSVKEAQKVLGCSQNSVLRRLWRGELKGEIKDGWWMMREVDVKEYVSKAPPVNSINRGRFTGHEGPRPSNYGKNGKGR